MYSKKISSLIEKKVSLEIYMPFEEHLVLHHCSPAIKEKEKNLLR
jgi:hypothetical protein